MTSFAIILNVLFLQLMVILVPKVNQKSRKLDQEE